MRSRSVSYISCSALLFLTAIIYSHFSRQENPISFSTRNPLFWRWKSSSNEAVSARPEPSKFLSVNSSGGAQPTSNIEIPIDSQESPSAVIYSACDAPPPPAYPLEPPNPRLPQVVLDYIAFHKTARACLLDPHCKNKPPILVANCPRHRSCLGLGDRLSGLEFTFSIALITKRVLFLHNLGSPFPLQAGLAPFVIDWTLPSTVSYNNSWPYLEWYFCRKGKPCYAQSPALGSFSNFDDQGTDINMFTDDIPMLFSGKPVVSLACRIKFRGVKYLRRNPFLSDTYDEFGRSILAAETNVRRLLFKPSEATRQVLQTVQRFDDYFSVHVRTGIDTNETRNGRFEYIASHEKEVVVKTLQCLSKLRKDMNISNVFVASDSTSTKEIFLRIGKQKGFIIALLADPSIHMAKNGTYRSMSVDALCKSYLSVFADVFMLAGGQVMIRTASHFSMFALKLGGNPIIQIQNGKQELAKWCRF